MNKIIARLTRSRHTLQEHLVIAIDDSPLDSLIANHTGKESYEGLVPTLLNWMESNLERQLTWDRIRPDIEQTTICPFPLCPDDLDFSCTVIVASERTNEESTNGHSWIAIK